MADFRVRKRLVLAVAAALTTALGIYGLYYVSPYGRHDRTAAGYENRIRAQVRALGDVTITSGRHEVGGNRWGNGGECGYVVTLEVDSALPADAVEDGLRARLDVQGLGPVEETVTPLDRSGARHRLRIEVGFLGEGGSLDLRCG
ncbi:hypothetical protein [Streptomyces sp. NRRL F-5123]|uniref:hypothetical protein n=1 Tax=Streptomyces sp. NRRL F-5123 TaxID=1463856 RepID=UPI0004E0AFDD|nr:hypothetical protein [Streptomyces sp. NRRL F-5123]